MLQNLYSYVIDYIDSYAGLDVNIDVCRDVCEIMNCTLLALLYCLLCARFFCVCV